MPFLRVVEVLPPLFPRSRSRQDRLPLDSAMGRFAEEVRSIRGLADLILVANVKDPKRLRFDSVHAAVMLQEDFKLETAPVVVVRDQNRPQFLSTVLTAVSLGLNSLMVAWGDDYRSEASNVRDFPNLAKAIREAALIRARAASPIRLLAPVDIDSLSFPKGVALAKERIRAGADFLLAQPPTSDPGETFDAHASLVEGSGLKGRVLLNVFPFRGREDVDKYARLFGWRLPKGIRQAAAKGEGQLVDMERQVVRRLREGGFPGVCVSTRGTPRIAERLLS